MAGSIGRRSRLKLWPRRVPGAEGPIQVSLGDAAEMFNSIDPSPFHERDLDEAAERFIVNWACDLPERGPLALEVRLQRPGSSLGRPDAISEAIHSHFHRRAGAASRELRDLLRKGRASLVIGVVFLTGCVLLADQLAVRLPHGRLVDVLQQGLTVAGWVAMWRPMEIFLYSWWPIAGRRKLYDRLSRMPVSMAAGFAPEGEALGALARPLGDQP